VFRFDNPEDQNRVAR